MTDYTPDELMIVEAARQLQNGTVCFVGIGMPSTAANLARLCHAPDVVLIYESGTIGTQPDVLPLSIGDDELAEKAGLIASVPEVFAYWLQGGRIDVGFLGAAQLDRYGNINTTVVGNDYDNPKVRLPGAGGAPEIASHAKEVYVMLKLGKRSFVRDVDFITSTGYLSGGDSRTKTGAPGAGPTRVITDMGVLCPHPETKELIVTAMAPGAERDIMQENVSWDLQFADEVREMTPPTKEELRVLRDLLERTRIAHGASK
jgi:glutaconate CoA-transferase subunit B